MITVADVMTGQVRTLTSADTVERLRDVLHVLGIGSVPIVDEIGVVGIVTSRDVVEDWSPDLPLGTLMTDDVETVSAGTSVVTAARRMRERGIHHLVVSDDGLAVDGVVSSWDLLEALVDLVEELRAETVEPHLVEPGDGLVVRAGDGTGRRATIVEVHGRDGRPPYVVRWDDDPAGPATVIEVIPRGSVPLDGCER